MDWSAAVAEIRDDPLGRGYAAMTNQQVAESLRVRNRPVEVETIEGQAIFEATIPAEYAALGTALKDLFHAVIGMGVIRVKGPNTRAALASMFGIGTQTRANLLALQQRLASRAEELGLGELHAGDVAAIRERS